MQALEAGLTLPILNPNQKAMMDAVAAFGCCPGRTRGAGPTWPASPGRAPRRRPPPPPAGSGMTLEDAVIRGLRADAARLAKQALESEEPLSLVNNRLIPALDTVGSGYEQGTLFLPQLLSAAQAAQAVFEVLKDALARTGGGMEARGALAVATVRGDIHDIGKNIVKTVLENYGYQVIDLGRDVPARGRLRRGGGGAHPPGGPVRPDDHHPARHGGDHPDAQGPARAPPPSLWAARW